MPLVTDSNPVVGSLGDEARAGAGHGDHAVGGRTGIADHQSRSLAVDLHAAAGLDVHDALLIDGTSVRIGACPVDCIARDAHERALASHQERAAVADGGRPASASAQLSDRTGPDAGIAMNCRPVLNDLETRPRTIDQQCPDTALVACNIELRTVRPATVEDPEQSAVQNLETAVRAGVASHLDEARFLGVNVGEPSVGRRNDHSRAVSVGRDSADESPADAGTRDPEVQSVDQATVEHIEGACSFIADNYDVVGTRPWSATSPRRSRSRFRAIPRHRDGEPPGPCFTTVLDGQFTSPFAADVAPTTVFSDGGPPP